MNNYGPPNCCSLIATGTETKDAPNELHTNMSLIKLGKNDSERSKWYLNTKLWE